MRAITLVATLAFALPVAAIGQNTSGGNWNTYTNARFGYSLCYPATMLKSQAEADNADGRVFKGRNGAEMRVWGSNNAAETSLEDRMNRASMPVTDPNPRAYPRINYRKLYTDHYVVTGNSRDEDSFEKTYLKDGQFLTVQIKYPQADAKTWKPVVARINRCFKPGG